MSFGCNDSRGRDDNNITIANRQTKTQQQHREMSFHLS